MSLTDSEVAFLRGLIAGEGYFGIVLRNSKSHKFNVESGPAFQMKMAERSDILPLLQSKTGLGSVYETETGELRKDMESWRIRIQNELDELQTILGRDISNWEEFLLGLIAGEGYFGIKLRNRKSHKFNVQSEPVFKIKMAEQSNILPLLQSKTGLGSVYEEEARKESWADQEEWHMSDSAELDELANMIEAQEDSLFWETDKGETFNKWKEARELKEEIGTGDPEAVKEIIDIAKSLNGTSQGRSAEDWKAIVDEAMEE